MSDAQREPAAASGPAATTGPGREAEPGNHVLRRPGGGGTRGGVLSGFVVAGTGLVQAIRTERNLRIQIAVGGTAICLGGWFGLAATQWAILLLAIGLVITTELMNTALESAVDLVTTQFHPLAKLAKDVGAGASLVAALTSVGIGIALFAPRFAALL